MTETFAALAVALYAAHHVGDYWVQTDHQARHKGDAGHRGRIQCSAHVLSYLATQTVTLAMVGLVLGLDVSTLGLLAGLAVSGVTHYLADRREHGVMFKLARLLPGKADFLKLGVPHERLVTGTNGEIVGHAPGTPSLGTGAWALDQAWHIFWGVFVAALVMAAV